MSDTCIPYQIGDLAVPANGVVGPTYLVVDFDDNSVTVAWHTPDGRTYEKIVPHDEIELA